MRTFVYCARSWRISTILATWTIPKTCPPETLETFNPEDMIKPLIYLRLHGLPDQPYLYGDDYITALSIDQIRDVELPGSLVFLEGCYGMQFAGTFLTSGARAVIGSNEPTISRPYTLGEATRVGARWLKAIKHGSTAFEALLESTDKGGNSSEWCLAGNKEARLT